MYRKLAEELIAQLGKINHSDEPVKIDRFLEGEYAVLGYLATHEQTRPGDLCEELGMSSAHVAKTLRNLEAKGEITRAMDPGDRRKTLIQLNESGRIRIEEGWDWLMNELSQKLERLGEQDARELVRLLGRMAELG